ncbi:aspartate carbamoyltransferase catalytic subunit [Citreimonas salinaria]|uniref:Aspartate carbamoyltransferase catalytic subunit n=1 Tax=Citreimonas salinaria TaxID=321339 RepID=A0A1H3HQ58_9RHOB|nr:aspartate carbamoyltransferase catalytic subunit [Citreimonas salinaria]SDY17375.1 hypothetical protein SAMN05444340_10478 [Citreimonas salinaria]
MTKMRISGTERDVLRLFALDLPEDEAEGFVTQKGYTWPLRDALGADRLRTDFVDLVRVADLGDMPLSRYLREAHGVTEESLAGLRDRVDALEGVVVALPSQAFDGTTQTLEVRAPLRWIGTFGEERAEPAGAPLHSEAARGTVSGTKPSDAAMSGRIAAIALLVLFVLVGVMVWIAA